MVTRDVIEQYTKYIDPSEMIIEYYKNQPTAGLEKYFLEIEDWLATDVSPDNNKPLIIQADEGVGKKTLLVQWMKYHQQKSQKNFPDLIISHFVGTEGNQENYFYAIYKILVRLREHFAVSQKVELLEDKLERYFHYWLDVCSRALIGRIVDDSTIILVFEGINLFKDPDTHEEANVGLWLPKTFPYRIRVIITAESDSLALKRFEKDGCQIISIEHEPTISSTLSQNLLSRSSFITDESYRNRVIDILNKKSSGMLHNSLFFKTYLSALLPYPSEHIVKEGDINKEHFTSLFKNIDLKKLEELADINDLNLYILEYFAKNLIDNEEKFRTVMVALNITEKGLSDAELQALAGLTISEWNYILAVFKTFMMKYQDLYKINNETFKKAIRIRYTQDDPSYTIKLHNEIAEVLNKKTPNSIRKLEEETYHLYMSKNHFKLKEAVANIENFLLLFNPNNKYDLCRYWQMLEQKGFDPASEYTKAVEGFELHYRPNQEDTFMIILQVSRFLKEFSDFETSFTPQFRHPPIRGGLELKEIGLRREIKKLHMYQPEEWEPEDEEIDELEELEHKLAVEFPDYTDIMIKEMAKQIHSATLSHKPVNEHKIQAQDENKPDEFGDKKKLKGLLGGKERKSHELFLLNAIEALNVDIPDNREKFRAFVGGVVPPKKSGETVVDNKVNKEKFLDEDDEPPVKDEKDESSDNRGNLKKNISLSAGPPIEDKKESGADVAGKGTELAIEATEVEPTFYYYKRWLWMMYPWVCLSSKNNFSKIIYECFSSATEYMSVPDEREKTRQALKIAIEAKMKKQAVYNKADTTSVGSLSRLKESSLGKSNKKMLPPLTEKRQVIAPPSILDKDLSNTKLRLDTLSPIGNKQITKTFNPSTTTGKDSKFFITSEPLQTHYLTTDTNMEPSMIMKANMSNTSFQNMSLLNKTGNIRDLTKDKSMSILTTNRRVDEMIRSANDAVQQILLPKLQDAVLSVSSKQVDDLEQKVKQLQSSFDEIVYMNKTLAKKMKELTVLETTLKIQGTTESVARVQQRLVEVHEELAKAEKLKDDAIKQGQRLSKIIMVCVKNKSQNVLGVQSLNYLLNNFKKMITWEKEDLDQNSKSTVELEKLSKQYLKACEEKIKQQERAISLLKKEKMQANVTEKRLDSVYDNLEKTAVMTTEDMRRRQTLFKEAEEKRIRLETLKEKSKNAVENLEVLRETYKQIEDAIGLQFNGPKFQGFLDYIEKINDFQQSLYENRSFNEKLKEEKETLEGYLETLKKAKSSEKKPGENSTDPYKNVNDKDQLDKILKDKKKFNDSLGRETSKRTELVLNTKMVLMNVCKKLNLSMDSKSIGSTNLPVEEMKQRILDKVTLIKENITEEEYETFNRGEIDLNQRYRKRYEYFDIGEKDDDEDEEPKPNIFRKGAKIIENTNE